MPSPICLITGATGALGQATAMALTRRGATVVLGCRDQARGQAVRAAILSPMSGATVEVLVMDLASLASIRPAAAEFARRHDRLDVLVHTAGVYTARREVTPDGLELMFATNHLGPFLLTHRLLDRLKASAPARVILVSAPATTHLDFDDLQGERRFSSLTTFGASKSANLLFTYALARRLEGSGVTSNAFHPGLVKSGLMLAANAPLRWLLRLASAPPAKPAAALTDLALSPEFARTTGQFFAGRKQIESSAYSHDRQVQDRLWDKSLALTRLA